MNDAGPQPRARVSAPAAARPHRAADAPSLTDSARLAVSITPAAPAPAEAHGDNLSVRARTHLTRLLFGKALFEALFVAVLAGALGYGIYGPRFRGAVITADARQLTGWVLPKSAPAEPVEVQLYVDGQFAAAGRADGARPSGPVATANDVAGHWFVLAMPSLPPGPHVARVYAVHVSADGTQRTLHQLAGDQPFTVTADPAAARSGGAR